MSSPTSSSNTTDDFNILPASATAGVTDQDIAVLSRFLVHSTSKTDGIPLEYPRRRLKDQQTRGITHAPLNATSGFERSRKVLDALVAIAVCGGTQRLALSVSFGTTVRIIIAENDGTPSSMISRHLHSVWEQLRDLAKLQRSIRHESGLPDVLDLHGSSPEAAESHLAVADPRNHQLKAMKQKLHADIHQHCYIRSKHCIIKYLAPCAEFYKFYRQARAVVDPALVIADIVYYLAKISKMVTGYKGKFDPSGAPVDMDWYDLAKTSSLLLQMYLNDTVDVTARGNDVMTAWLGQPEVKGNRELRRFNFIRALEKTITLARHIEELFSFAYSPRLSSVLERQLDIHPLHPPTVYLPEPTAEDMAATVQRAFDATSFAMTRRIDEQEQLQAMRTEQLDQVAATVSSSVSKHSAHAEYTLLLHHHAESHNNANPPPFQYIAVSKPACFGCCSAYKSYTQLTGRIFSLRGSDSKLCFTPCPTTYAFDPAQAAAMRTRLYSHLVALYSEHLNNIQDARDRMGDNTASSRVDHLLQVDSDDVAAARREREEEEAAMDKGE